MQQEGLRAVIYARVSKDDGQTDGASSTDRQLEDCRMKAKIARYDVIAEEVDQGISAYGRSERPAWERVLGMVERGEIDVIVAWHVDRMTRNMIDLERLILLTEAHGVGVATATGDMDLTNDTGRMVARILAAVARAEVERKSARQRRANLARREEGIPWKSGWRSFGYSLDGELVPDEAALIRETAQWVLDNVSLREVARRWRSSGLSTPRSDKGSDGWTHSGIKAVLRNPKIAGYMTYRSEIVGDGAWEPILDRDTWALLTAKLNDPARKGMGSTGRREANLLSGIATCATCGERVTGGTRGVQKQENGVRRQVGRLPVYKCPNDHISTDRAEADQLVIDAFALAAEVMLPGLLLALPKQGESFELMAEAERKRQELIDLADSHAAGRIPLVVLEQASAKIAADLEAMERAAMGANEIDYDPRKLNREALAKFIELDTDGKRAWLKRLTEISLHPRGKGNKGRAKVPITEQISMRVAVAEPDGTSRSVAVLGRSEDDAQVPDAFARLARPSDLIPAMSRAGLGPRYLVPESFDALAYLLVNRQPEAVDTLVKASHWLANEGFTTRKPTGLPGRLSPLVRYDRHTSRWEFKSVDGPVGQNGDEAAWR